MIRDEAMREKIKSLWKLCFNDSDEFTDMYFRLRYSNEVNIAIQSGEEVIAALQILPYPMTFGKSEIKTGYVSGACTHPDYRNRGAMRELLSQAFTRMLHNDMSISTLIPAEPWLFGYYAGMGYVPVFKYSSTTFTASEVTIADKTAVLNKINDYQEESYRYLNRKLRERPYCIQHTETDFRVILADLQLGKGCAYTLKQGDKITALAIVYPAGSTWQAGEIVCPSCSSRGCLAAYCPTTTTAPIWSSTATVMLTHTAMWSSSGGSQAQNRSSRSLPQRTATAPSTPHRAEYCRQT